MIVIYVATKNQDAHEGRGPVVPFAHFYTKDAALKAIKGQGVMGIGDGGVDELVVWDSFEEYKNYHRTEVIKQRALKKLTEDERRVLGLS